jgi:flagellar biosynthetic protein FliR
MESLSHVVIQDLWPYFLVGARVIGALVALPGFSEAFVNGRVRFFIAIGLTLVITPLLADSLVDATVGSPYALLILAGEFVVGIFIGLMAKMVMSALDVAGTVIGFQMSLANAFAFNPGEANQGNLIGVFLGITAITLIFVMDLHYYMILGIYESYNIITPGKMIPFESFSNLMVEVVSKSFLVGAKIAAPFIILGTTVIMALGLLNRLMPQVQIYFISQPFVIGVGFFVLAVTLGALMNTFLDFAGSIFSYFIGGRF